MFLRQEIKNYLCSTHPHNYHLEVLHDTGILGFSLTTLFTFALLIKFFTSYTAKEINYVNKVILGLLIINFLVEIFPLKSSGSLFTTWNGTLTWLTIALLITEFIKKMKNKKVLITYFLFLFFHYL